MLGRQLARDCYPLVAGKLLELVAGLLMIAHQSLPERFHVCALAFLLGQFAHAHFHQSAFGSVIDEIDFFLGKVAGALALAIFLFGRHGPAGQL